MKMRYAISRQSLFQAASRLAQDKDTTTETAIAKIYVSEAALANAVDAAHLHGGRGFLAGTGIGNGVSATLAGPTCLGTNDIQRGRIAAMMGMGA